MPGKASGGMGRRIGALEERALEVAVERRLAEEIDAVLDALQERLPREEFRRVLEIVTSLDGVPREGRDG